MRITKFSGQQMANNISKFYEFQTKSGILNQNSQMYKLY